jgi:hypothetical protein
MIHFFKKDLMIPGLFFCMFYACGKDQNHPDCYLIPDSGPCKGSFTKYYFDKTEKKCAPFIWGGCGGVVPFQTFVECNNKCPCGK